MQGKGRHRNFESNGRNHEDGNGISNDVDFDLIEQEASIPDTAKATSNDIPKENTLVGEGGIELGEGVFANPCTGSISSDTTYTGDTFPCLQATNMPSTSPAPSVPLIVLPKITPQPTPSAKLSPKPSVSISQQPSKSSEPSISPFPSISNSPTAVLDMIFCPGETYDCNTTDENNESNTTRIVVNFKYSVETVNATQDPYTILPQLERDLLKYLAGNLLDHCKRLLSGTESQSGELKLRRFKKRMLQQHNKKDAVGICSMPKDEFMKEDSCEPELSNFHNCFVIDGGVTVFFDDDANLNREEVVAIIKNKTKEAMVNDDLVTVHNPEVKKVKYFDQNNITDPGNIIGSDDETRASGEPPISIVVGASIMALAGLFGFYLVKRQAKKYAAHSSTEDHEVDEIMMSPNSFVAPDSKDLGKVSTLMDVHECKSAVCPKCYVDPNVSFVRTGPYPHLDPRSPLNSENSAETVEGCISSDESLG